MLNHFRSYLLLSLPALLAGCTGNSPAPSETQPPLAWVEKDIVHEGTKISLGHRSHPHNAERWLEPVATISRDGKPVANAMVFNSLLAADGSQVVVEEVATVYEPPAGESPGLYAQGKMKLPPASSPSVVHFRIVFPDSEQEWTRDIELPLK